MISHIPRETNEKRGTQVKRKNNSKKDDWPSQYVVTSSNKLTIPNNKTSRQIPEYLLSDWIDERREFLSFLAGREENQLTGRDKLQVTSYGREWMRACQVWYVTIHTGLASRWIERVWLIHLNEYEYTVSIVRGICKTCRYKKTGWLTRHLSIERRRYRAAIAQTLQSFCSFSFVFLSSSATLHSLSLRRDCWNHTHTTTQQSTTIRKTPSTSFTPEKMVNLIELLSDEREQLRLWQSFLLLLGINWKKCPPFRQVLRVNLCCLNSAIFFFGTWIVFYLMVVCIFCGAVAGTASLMGIKWRWKELFWENGSWIFSPHQLSSSGYFFTHLKPLYLILIYPPPYLSGTQLDSYSRWEIPIHPPEKQYYFIHAKS